MKCVEICIYNNICDYIYICDIVGSIYERFKPCTFLIILDIFYTNKNVYKSVPEK